ncbi:MAG: hypothetical protein IT452_06095 [Planctomycetia bacterium]|nr:hypothetical protein [Planctomycetia bacterium]
MPDLKDIILGNIAVERGLVPRETLLDLQRQQRDSGLPLGQVMLRAGVVNGPKLIELMKLVSVTIEHLDGGLEVGADSADASGPPAIMVGSANEPSKPPTPEGAIPVAPVVGGGPARTAPQKPAAAAQAPAGPRSTYKPPAAAAPVESTGTRTPAPIPSPFETTPRPAPPPQQPKTGRFTRPAAAGKPKTDAFVLGQVEAPKPAAPPAKPKTAQFMPAEAPPPAKPKTDRLEAARAGGRTPSEAFRVELAAREKKSDVPQVQGAFGESVAGAMAPKQDKTRLYTPVDIPKPTPAGKLPPEEVDGAKAAGKEISVPPAARNVVPGVSEGMVTPAGRLPSGIDAESRPLASPLDDSKILPPSAPPFEMPAGAETAKGRPSRPPSPGTSRTSRPPVTGRPSRPPGSGPIPTAPQEPGHRMLKPDDSGFIAESRLPDFEVRASDSPGGKPVVVQGPNPPAQTPRKETRRLGPGKGPGRPLRRADSPGAAGTQPVEAEAEAAKTDGEQAEAPPKRSKKLLVFLLILLFLVLGAGGALFYLGKLSIEDFKHLKDGFKQVPDTLKDADYWKKLFLPK